MEEIRICQYCKEYSDTLLCEYCGEPTIEYSEYCDYIHTILGGQNNEIY